MDVDFMAAEMTKEGNYEVKSNKLYIAESGEEIDNVAGNPYKVTADTLSIEMAHGEETEDIIPGMEYPLSLNKIK